MAGKRSIFKNIVLAVLFACAVIQTGMLWLDGSQGHNIFYYLSDLKFYNKGTNNPVSQIKPMDIALGNGDGSFKKIFEGTGNIEVLCDSMILESVENSEAEYDESFSYQEALFSRCAVYEFGVSVPFGEYLEGMGISKKPVTEYIKNFNSIVIIPSSSQLEKGRVCFVNAEGGVLSAVSYIADYNEELNGQISSSASDPSLRPVCISTALSGFNLFKGNFFVPQFGAGQESFYTVTEEPCIDIENADEEYMIESTEQYFNRYTSKKVSAEPSGVRMVSDASTIVKCYPSGVLEYFSYETESKEEQQSLSSAYYACINFLKKDTSIKTGYYLSDVRLTGEGLVFGFDYCISSMPVVIGRDISEKAGIDHSIEVVVTNNSVRKLKKYNSNFVLSDKAETAEVDFLTAVNYAMGLDGGEGQSIDNIRLARYLNEDNKTGISWIVDIGDSTYVIDAISGSISVL